MENDIKKDLNRKNLGLEKKLPIKVVQFGEGNFLRAFVDYAFQKLNKELDFNAGVAVVQPLENGMVQMLNDQDGLYTLFLNGIKKGEKIQEIDLITNVVKGINPFSEWQDFLNLATEEELQFIISNTTEAGIEYIDSDTPEMQPPIAFPARLTLLMNERFKHFNGDYSKGLTVIPCELINYNADTLKEIILRYSAKWDFGQDFENWLNESCSFHNTLVDRIVPGYPRNEIEEYNSKLDYKDNLIVTAEPFFLWVIEGGEDLKAKLPFDKTNLNVKIVEDMQVFRTLKVRILNGTHTAMVPFCLLNGKKIVRESIDDQFTGKFVQNIIHEINGSLDMDKAEVEAYSEEVLDRFRNPFIKHLLSDIALNSISKFKVRVLPSLLQHYQDSNKLPKNLTFAFACLLLFYKGEFNGEKMPLNDSPEIIQEFNEAWKSENLETFVQRILSNEEFWGQDLSKINGLKSELTSTISAIENNGIEQTYFSLKKEYQS